MIHIVVEVLGGVQARYNFSVFHTSCASPGVIPASVHVGYAPAML
jgi:hypothetical protein